MNLRYKKFHTEVTFKILVSPEEEQNELLAIMYHWSKKKTNKQLPISLS